MLHSDGVILAANWGRASLSKKLFGEKIFDAKALMAAAVLTVFMPFSAQAADAAFCQNYAHAAVNQVRGALANPRCAASIQGARWSPDLQVHYNWCLSQPYAAAGAERDARTNFLRACRG
jgi:hypothetical protein